MKASKVVHIITLAVSIGAIIGGLIYFFVILVLVGLADAIGQEGGGTIQPEAYLLVVVAALIPLEGLLSFICSIVGLVVISKKQAKSFLPLAIFEIISLIGIPNGITLLIARKQ